MNILFVSHAANRSGAPLVLLELLRYLKRETPHQATLLSLRDGVLMDEFAQVATLFEPSAPFVRASKLAAARRRLQKLDFGLPGPLDSLAWSAQRLNGRQSRAKARDLERRFDLVYLNSVASGDVMGALEPVLRRAPLLAHVHELGYAIDGLGSAFADLKKRAAAFVAVSDAVKMHLVDRGVEAKKIETVYEFVDFTALQTSQQGARLELRARLRLPAETFLVGGCGTMEWRKGADFWALLAAQAAHPDIHFVWLGGQENEMRRQIDFDLARLKLQKRVHFLPPTNNTPPFFAALDAFALTSREDPFPLVGVEAAAQNVPVLCFQDAGGMSELVGEDAGFVAPYGDVGAMARHIESWRCDEGLRSQLGQNAARKARAMSDTSVGAPQIMALMEKIAR